MHKVWKNPTDLWAMRGKLPHRDASWPVIELPSVMLVNFLYLACGDNAVWLQSINGPCKPSKPSFITSLIIYEHDTSDFFTVVKPQ